jgi:hypothetical protein
MILFASVVSAVFACIPERHYIHTPGLLLAHTFYVTELGRNTANVCVCVRKDLLYEHLLCRDDHLFLFSSRSGDSMWL